MAFPTPFFKLDFHSSVILWRVEGYHSVMDMATGMIKYGINNGIKVLNIILNPSETMSGTYMYKGINHPKYDTVIHTTYLDLGT